MKAKTISLSFEPSLITVMDRRVRQLDTDRSKYIRKLVREDMEVNASKEKRGGKK